MITLQGTKQKEETLGLIALAWGRASVGEEIQIIQPNDMGGKSLEKLVLNHFPDVITDSRNKSRYITVIKEENEPDIILEWMAHARLRYVEQTGFYSMPGLFGWDKIDVGSRLLLDHLPDLKGIGCDFGCGYGYLSKNILLKNEKIKALYCFDYDNRAIDACKLNIDDARAVIRQADCTRPIKDVPPHDFIIMNPPFHDGNTEDKQLGIKFIETAAHHLRNKGALWMVANRHLPYEPILANRFTTVDKIIEKNGFKIFKALK